MVPGDHKRNTVRGFVSLTQVLLRDSARAVPARGERAHRGAHADAGAGAAAREPAAARAAVPLRVRPRARAAACARRAAWRHRALPPGIRGSRVYIQKFCQINLDLTSVNKLINSTFLNANIEIRGEF